MRHPHAFVCVWGVLQHSDQILLTFLRWDFIHDLQIRVFISEKSLQYYEIYRDKNKHIMKFSGHGVAIVKKL